MCSSDLVKDQVAMSREIKQLARSLGAGTAGITPVIETALYRGMSPDYPNAVVILYPMDPEEMAYVTQDRAGVETMRAYNAIARTTIDLAAEIRAMGYRARAYCEAADILHNCLLPLKTDSAPPNHVK